MQHNLQIIMTRTKTVPLFADLRKTRVKFFFQNENNNWIAAVFGGCIKQLPPVTAHKKFSVQCLTNCKELSQIFDVSTVSTIGNFCPAVFAGCSRDQTSAASCCRLQRMFLQCFNSCSHYT